jgi:splicing factor 3A subunit 1
LNFLLIRTLPHSQDANAIGPGIGPAAAPPQMAGPPPAALPTKPVGAPAGNEPAYAAATVSAGPQPASMYPNQPPPVMLPPLHYQGLDAAQPFGYQPPPTGVRGPPPAFSPPSAAPGTPGTPGIGGVGTPGAGGAGTPNAGGASTPGGAGTVRGADEMDGDGDGDGAPPAKRQRVAKLPPGQYYPEADWVAMHPHPVSLRVQMPTDPAAKAEYKLDGALVTVPGLLVEWTVATLRDRLAKASGSALTQGKFRFSYNGKMLTNQNSLASYNLEDEDVLVASVQDKKKK